MQKVDKKIAVIGGIIVLLILIIFVFMFFFTDKKPVVNYNNNKVTIKTIIDDKGDEQIIATATEVYSTTEQKQKQSTIKLPKEYNPCKKDTNMMGCIVFYDKEKEKPKTFVSEKFIVERLDEIDDFKKELLKSDTIETKENLEGILIDELQVYYTLTNSAMIFEEFACESDFCKETIIGTKKTIVGRMIARQKIDTNKCNRIPENEVKKYCLETLAN